MRAVLLLGTNLNDRVQNLNLACKQIIERIGMIESESRIYITTAWGNTKQPDFLNKILVVKTALSPQKLLQELLEIEKQMGRVRTIKWAPRLIDLDILYFGDMIVHESGLTIPHPFIQDRRFALIPLVEVIPDYIHPVLHITNAELLAKTSDVSEVFLYESSK